MTHAPVTRRTLPIRLVSSIKQKSRIVYSRVISFIDKKPLLSFFAALTILLLLIVVSQIIGKKDIPSDQSQKIVKTVTTYSIGKAPMITVGASIRKTGVIQIVALTNGVINRIFVEEGSQVKRGETLLTMGSNYQGGSTFSLQRQIAQQQYTSSKETYPKQKEIIEKQIELADKTQENSEEIRKITESSVEETKTLVNQNQNILTTLQNNLKTLQQNNGSSAEILTLQQQIAQYQASTNQASQTLRNVSYQAGSDNPPSETASLTKEITKKQLEVQLKQLEVNLEISRLQVAIAQVNESLLFPTAPFSGTIQRVLIKEKEVVTPGTPLFIISQVAEEDPITAIVFVSADIAKRVSRIEPSTLYLGKNIRYVTTPSFVSTDAVQGSLYAIYFPIPDEYNSYITNEGSIKVEIPLGIPDTTMIATYIPLDAIYQTTDEAFVFVSKNERAESKKIQLGEVYGRYVEVLSGLSQGDTVILDRTVVQGDSVQIQ